MNTPSSCSGRRWRGQRGPLCKRLFFRDDCPLIPQTDRRYEKLVSRCLRVGGVPCECVVGRGRREMRVCVRRAPPPVTPTPTLPRPPSARRQVCAARSPLRTRPWWGLPRARPSARASARSRPRTPHARSGTAGEGLTHIAEGSGPRAPSSCSCTSQPLGRAPSPPARGGGTRACCGAAAPLPDCGGALWVEGGAAPATVWRSSCSSTPQMASFPRPAIHPSSNGRSVWSGSCPQTAHSVDAAGSVCGREA